ncbi:MAG: mercury resistance system transport protein MerF [Rhodothermales bacterium]
MKQEKYTDNKLVLFGGIATAIAALCCFTPLLVWGLAAIGAAALVSYLDYALLPLLVLFGAMTFIGIQQVQQRRRTSGSDGDGQDVSESPD